MSDLLRADFKRVLKDRLLIVMGILATVFALITPLLYVLLFEASDFADDTILSSMVSAKTQFFSSFSFGNNLGLIAPVLLMIVLCKDFSFGTVRNKVIAGKSRSAIFLSMFIVCSVILVAVMLLHAFITLGFCLIFFEYQESAFTISDFWYFLESLSFDVLSIVFIAAMMSWLCAAMKNVGLAIVMYVAITFALVMVGSIIQVVISIMEFSETNKTIVEILRFIDRINVANSSTYIGMGAEYTLEDVLYFTVPALVGIFGFAGLGLLKFNRKDLK